MARPLATNPLATTARAASTARRQCVHASAVPETTAGSAVLPDGEISVLRGELRAYSPLLHGNALPSPSEIAVLAL
jgi:hypothetical protein